MSVYYEKYLSSQQHKKKLNLVLGRITTGCKYFDGLGRVVEIYQDSSFSHHDQVFTGRLENKSDIRTFDLNGRILSIGAGVNSVNSDCMSEYEIMINSIPSVATIEDFPQLYKYKYSFPEWFLMSISEGVYDALSFETKKMFLDMISFAFSLAPTSRLGLDSCLDKIADIYRCTLFK